MHNVRDRMKALRYNLRSVEALSVSAKLQLQNISAIYNPRSIGRSVHNSISLTPSKEVEGGLMSSLIQIPNFVEVMSVSLLRVFRKC